LYQAQTTQIPSNFIQVAQDYSKNVFGAKPLCKDVRPAFPLNRRIIDPCSAGENLSRGTSMIVGCPKEIKNHEYRVGLTPGAAREYVAHGHQVLIEMGAGAGIGADDAAYEAVGARVVATAAEIFAKSDMIVKVKEPQPSEWAQLREGQILYTYLHLAPDPAFWPPASPASPMKP
jgi:hypothetical protein